MKVPSFAVLGHPNKGKSSIVAALAHDRSVVIGAVPGTTVDCQSFPMSVDGKILYNLIDTPGFQRPRQVLEWIQSRETSLDKHPEVLQEFVKDPENRKKFPDETKLLEPVLEGAGIVYVVDGSVPYGDEYESEMEILRWTAQPSLAIVNPIGGEEYVEQWITALRQFFNVVHVFNPLTASFEKRLELLSSFSSLEPTWKEPLLAAVSILKEDRLRHIEQAASIVSNSLFEILSLKKELKLKVGQHEQDVIAKAEESYRIEIISKETKARRRVEELYAQDSVKEENSLIKEFDNLELFSEESWKLFGLSRKETTAIAAMSGAAVGTALDISVGGASLFLGALVGGVLGAGAALFGGEKLVDNKVLMLPMGKRLLVLGPAKNTNLGFVLLARARLHNLLIAERSYASRDSLKVGDAIEVLLEPVEMSDKTNFNKIFKNLRDEKIRENDLENLKNLLQEIFNKDLMKYSSR